MNYNEIVKNIKPGDFGLVRSKGIVPSAIRWFMKKDMERRGLKLDKLYNHAFTVVSLWDQLYVVEAMEDGMNVRPLNIYIKKIEEDRVLFRTPKKKYTNSEKEKISVEGVKFALNPTKYDYLSLLFYDIVKALTGKWIGKKGNKADNRMYCTEAVATLSNIVRHNTFNLPEAASPIDLQINKYYKDLV